MITIVGLGNPGEKYVNNRHNAGRMAVQNFESRNKNYNELKIKIITPDTFMNHSGRFVANFFKDSLPTNKREKLIENLVIVYDDIDLPLGTIKISYNKSSGGHNGLESVIKALKTKEFVRIRIGVAPTTPTGKLKKPQGKEKVLKFLLGDFTTKEIETFKKVLKKVNEAILVIAQDGREKAMNLFN